MKTICFLLAGFSAFAQTHENLNALVWMQRSAEYRSLTLQTYEGARRALQDGLKDKKRWTAALEQEGAAKLKKLSPAIVLDLDETVLDNSGFQARLLRENLAFSDALWQEWVAQEQAGAMPGAREFLEYVWSKKVTPFYITNRVCDAGNPEDHTVKVLKRLGFPLLTASQLLCKQGAESNKSQRRRKVAETHRIVLLLGDDLNDFVTVTERGVAARDAAWEANKEKWGKRWFVLPNPMYGSWERAIGYAVEEKRGALRP